MELGYPKISAPEIHFAHSPDNQMSERIFQNFSSRLCLPERHKHNTQCADIVYVCLVCALSDRPQAQLYGRLVCQVPALVTFIMLP